MTPTLLFYIIIGILLFNFLLDRVLSALNQSTWKEKKPKKLDKFYTDDEYQKARAYARTNGSFGLFSSVFSLMLVLLMLFLGGFAWLNEFLSAYTTHPIILPLLYFGVLFIASDVLGIPFALYHTFNIEERFGFNKTTIGTFIGDKVKGYFLAIILGGGLGALVIWLYHQMGDNFWWITWIVVSMFMIFITAFYASLILPLFNKLKPVEGGELKTAVTDYCKKVGFELDNLFVMDGSKRSSKANAFFSGLGKRKKIVLFDTLIEKHTTEELVAVLAHEVGHYKKKHTLQAIILSILQTGLLLFILSFFISSPILSNALDIPEPSFHIGIIVFSFLYAPLLQIMSIFMNVLSRKNEFEADAYAKETYGAAPLIDGLQKMSVTHLSNLTPHPWFVFFHYSHPPVLERIEALKK